MSPRRAALALLLAVLALGLAGLGAGCGGDDDDDGGEAATTAATTAETETETAAPGADGAAVFASAGCGSCHTLEAAGSTGTVGPSLDDLQPSVEQVEKQVREGGGGMPSFEGQLTDEEIQAVAQYVSESASG
jgi:mono/diheme cytochrome c family protein